MAAKEDYNQGFTNGKTAATLESIAEAIDDIRRRLDDLPCVECSERLTSLETGRDVIKWVVGLLFGTGILVTILTRLL